MTHVRPRLTEDGITRTLLVAQVNSDIKETHDLFSMLFTKELGLSEKAYETFWHSLQTIVNNIDDINQFNACLMKYKLDELRVFFIKNSLTPDAEEVMIIAVDIFNYLAQLRFLLLQIEEHEESHRLGLMISSVNQHYLAIINNQANEEAKRVFDLAVSSHEQLLSTIVDEANQLKNKAAIDKKLEDSLNRCRHALSVWEKVETKIDGLLTLKKHRLWQVCAYVKMMHEISATLHDKLQDLATRCESKKPIWYALRGNAWGLALINLQSLNKLTDEIRRFSLSYSPHSERLCVLKEAIDAPIRNNAETTRKPSLDELAARTDTCKKKCEASMRIEKKEIIAELPKASEDTSVREFLRKHGLKMGVSALTVGAIGAGGAAAVGVGAVGMVVCGASSGVVGAASEAGIELIREEGYLSQFSLFNRWPFTRTQPKTLVAIPENSPKIQKNNLRGAHP